LCVCRKNLPLHCESDTYNACREMYLYMACREKCLYNACKKS